ncbi:MAG: 16S rRNA (adenine(1518)-N(6)/adenine(1519)-N(6))-dimethyltransferase RsmA [Candidatus Helarchaeota archaeon]|nr:16S rRNA (adenine(1518)-N(6)/adenine(1519)-N(6))-dimethyltransferase RsmA [Candidatus Helarchaeota archaeon]
MKTRTQLIAEIKDILKKYNLRAFKSYSQNFMIEPALIRWQVEYSNLNKSDIVVEIGAGLGTLTKELAETAKKVIAVESDPKMVEVLQSELSVFNNIEIIPEDVLNLNSKIFEGTKIISNPPYKISSPLTFKIIEASYILALLSYQREFAVRMVAEPGSKEFGRLSLGVKYYAKVEYLKSISRGFFYPVPKVDSALIRLTPCTPPFELANKKDFFEFVRHLFSFRNKTVKHALNLYLKHREPKNIETPNSTNDLLMQKRVFQLGLEQFHELYQIFQ